MRKRTNQTRLLPSKLILPIAPLVFTEVPSGNRKMDAVIEILDSDEEYNNFYSIFADYSLMFKAGTAAET